MSQPSGWYDDPQNPANLRYWDGVLWTDHTVPKQAPAPQPQQPQTHPGPTAYRAAAGQGQGHAPQAGQSAGQAPRDAGAWTDPSGRGGMYNEPPSNYGYGAAPQPPAWAPLGRVTPDGRPLAEPWQRLLAAILDNVILGILTTAITFPLWKDFASAYLRWIGDLVEDPTAPEPELAEVTAMVQDTLGPNIIWITLITLAISLAYQTFFLVRSGATPGKMALRIRVRRAARPGPLTVGEALRRQLLDVGFQVLGAVPIISLLTPVVSVLDKLWLLWDPRRQTLHDKVADTLVEQKPKPGMP